MQATRTTVAVRTPRAGEGVRLGDVPVALRRPEQEPQPSLVRHERLRQRRQGAALPRATAEVAGAEVLRGRYLTEKGKGAERWPRYSTTMSPGPLGAAGGTMVKPIAMEPMRGRFWQDQLNSAMEGVPFT